MSVCEKVKKTQEGFNKRETFLSLISSKEHGTYIQFPIAVKKVRGLGYEDLEDK